jgi:penicillin-binding protein A
VNRPIRKVAVACLVLFLALLVNANWVQVGQAARLRAQPSNDHPKQQALERERGSIIAGTQTIASSVAVDDQFKYQRQYPASTATLYAPVTGYFGPFVATTGLERAENDILSGQDSRLFVSKVSDLVTGHQQRGGTIVTTLVPAVQQAAAAALAGRKGAAVALDPRTGEILAMVTNPGYDPNPLASHNQTTALNAYKALAASGDEPLLNRATQETYPPGSTFKLVTAAAALAQGVKPEDSIDAPRQLQLPQSTAVLKNFDNEQCGDGQHDTFIDALTISCNTAFAELGMKVGAGALQKQAEAFGFNSTFPDFGLAQAKSVFPTSLSAAQTAQSAIGQFEVRVTPLQMAQVAAAIGNNGHEMAPYVVKELLGPDLKAISRTSPHELGTPVTSDVAANLTTMMTSVVQHGTGTSAQIPGVVVAGKTGTAQHGATDANGNFIDPPHAWFVGFAPAVNPTVAVAVVIENGGGELSATGGALAAPVAKAMMQAALARQQ